MPTKSSEGAEAARYRRQVMEALAGPRQPKVQRAKADKVEGGYEKVASGAEEAAQASDEAEGGLEEGLNIAGGAGEEEDGSPLGQTRRDGAFASLGFRP